jgi:glucose-6-phosphate isomerase
VTADLEVPGRDFTFGELQAAQAMGDLRALSSRGRPVLRLHLTDRKAGLDALLAVAAQLADG